jgi:hypothetical protein
MGREAEQKAATYQQTGTMNTEAEAETKAEAKAMTVTTTTTNTNGHTYVVIYMHITGYCCHNFRLNRRAVGKDSWSVGGHRIIKSPYRHNEALSLDCHLHCHWLHPQQKTTPISGP